MPIKFSNNASTRLAAPITSASLSLTVESGGGDKFPITAAEEYFYATIVAADNSLEIVKCTARSGDTFTIVRAQEGTTAKDFSAGSTVELRLTAAGLTDFVEEAETRLEGIIDTLEGYKVGDYLTTVRDPGVNWLKRDGQLYLKAEYPDLSSILPDLPDGFVTDENMLPTLPHNRVEIFEYVDGKYVFFNAFHSDSAPKFIMYSSADGQTFAQESAEYDGLPRKFAFGNGKYLLTDYKYQRSPVWYSTDGGVTWTMTANQNGTNSVGAAGYFPEIDTFFIGGANGFAKKSQNLTSWTTVSGVLGTTWIQDFVYGDGKLIAHGNQALSWTSNGTTWTSATTGIGATIQDACFGNGTWVVVGSDGKIVTSTDLTNWYSRTSGVTEQIVQVVFTGTGFVARTNSGFLMSDDGVTWTKWDYPGGTQAISAICVDVNNSAKILAFSVAGNLIYEFMRTSPDQFAVPDDNPINGYIKAV